MDLREVKKEVQNLPNITELVEKFTVHWLKPIRANTNLPFPFLVTFSSEKKKNFNKKLAILQETLGAIQYGQTIHEKSGLYARFLVELKLAILQGNHSKARTLSRRFLKDDFLNFQNTIKEVKLFKDNIAFLSQQYKEFLELLQQELPLEESVAFLELPHKTYFQQLQKIPSKQNKIMGELGRQFLMIMKEIRT